MPLDHLYRLIANSREYFYRRGLLSSHHLPGYVISIGNLTTGGTGKTPLVIHAARILHDAGEKVCVLTRGYGRANAREQLVVSDGENVIDDVRLSGDEAMEIALKLRGIACVIANSDRVAAARFAREKFQTTTFLLDDGFQHFRVKRDLDIVCVDAMNPFGNRKLLPLGILRESPEKLKRADAVVITRSDLVEDLSELENEITRLNSSIKRFRVKNELKTLSDLRDFCKGKAPELIKENDAQETTRYFAFCAIGNPASFFEGIRKRGYSIAGQRSFRDHSFYSEEILKQIENEARNCNADALLTTAKDAVKISLNEIRFPCYVAEIDLRMDNSDEFRKLLLNSKPQNTPG